jgi:hypothetical protein
VLGGEVAISSVFFALGGLYLGKLTGHDNDGCLLAIVNILAAMCGAGVGFFFGHYPIYLLTTLAGTLIFPLISSMLAVARFRGKA